MSGNRPMTLADWAELYADRHRWAVFPLQPRGKVPATEHGCKDASADPGMVREMWEGRPGCNIGLATGPVSGVFVFDVDGKAPPPEKEGGPEGVAGPEALAWLEARWGALPPTRRALTSGGGWHLYFRWPAGRVIKNRARIRVQDGRRAGLDVRGDGGYVVLPPSVHPSGELYRWADGPRDIAEAPGWLLDLLDPPKSERMAGPIVGPVDVSDRYVAAVLRRAAEAIAGAGEGARHDAIFREAAAVGELVGGGVVGRAEAEAVLVGAAMAAGKSEREARRTVADGLAKGEQSPRRPEQREYRPERRRTEGPMVETPPWDEPIPGERWADDEPAQWAGGDPDTEEHPPEVADEEAARVLAEVFAEATSDREAPTPEEPERCTDLGNARVLVRLSGRDFRWCAAMPGTGWMRWDGARWQVDDLHAVDRAAQRVPEWWREEGERQTTRAEAMKVEAGDDPEAQERAAQAAKAARKVLGWATASEAATRLSAAVKLAATHRDVATAHAAWDARPELLCTPEATYNLATMRRYAPRRGDLLTRRTSVSADASGCPTWESFVLRIMGDDPILAMFLQRCLGYSLVGNPDQLFFIAYGASGANGKSTLINVMRDILGDYLVTTRVETFLERPAGGIPNDLAALAGARVVTCSEPKEGAELDVGLIKLVTGGDPVSARFLNREFFSFVPNFALWYVANHKPRISDAGYAAWRRVMLIPFEVTIPETERDSKLGQKLRAEAPGILRWMLDGLKGYRMHGLNPPQSIRQANAAYREESDLLGAFIEECLESEMGTTTATGDLYAVYRDWCADQGLRPVTQIVLGRKLGDRGWRQLNSRRNGRLWDGMKLTRKPRQAEDRGGARMWPPRVGEA